MKTEIKEITTETDLIQNRVRLLSEAQKALANKDADLATFNLWLLLATVDKDSTPRKELEKVFETVKSQHVEMTNALNVLVGNMQILEGEDFKTGHSETIKMKCSQMLYTGFLDVLIRWELVK